MKKMFLFTIILLLNDNGYLIWKRKLYSAMRSRETIAHRIEYKQHNRRSE